MGGQYFGDVLEDGDKRMDYEVEKPNHKDAIKLLSLKLKSAPAKNMSLSNGVDMVRGGKEGAFDFKHKTEFKNSCDEQDWKFVVTNKGFEGELEYTPADFNKDGMHTSIELEGKSTPAKNAWEGKVELKTGGFELGPMTPWVEVSKQSLLICNIAPTRHQQ